MFIIDGGGEWSTSQLEERIAIACGIGGWVDPKSSLDILEKQKVSCPN
jgi:hypothetical protein